MIDEYGYLENIMAPMREMRKTLDYNHQGDTMGDEWNHSDNEVLFITYWGLACHTFKQNLKQKYVQVTN